MSKTITFEIFVEGQWWKMGTLDVSSQHVSSGYSAPSLFQYSLTYVSQFTKCLYSKGLYSASVRYSLDFGPVPEKTWSPFLLDILPAGAARKSWLTKLNLQDGPTADIELLQRGGINPPGNIRSQPDEDFSVGKDLHPGFDYQEVVGRGVDFVEYAERMGAIVSGTSGAQGEAPKFLLVTDKKGRWHGDGAISDSQVQQNWLMKFPRGKKDTDYLILETEAKYYEIARDLGLKVKGPLKWDNNNLFIPRFDRDRDAQGIMVRYGLESLVSAMGIADFGMRRFHEDYIKEISRHSSLPKVDIEEYVLRDFLNIVLGNTDNHGRNTAFLKTSAEEIRISPLFDFAPMVLDDSVIPRATKWREEDYHIPNFASIQQCMMEHGFDMEEAIAFFIRSRDRLGNLKSFVRKHRVEAEIDEIVTRKYDPFMKALETHLESI